MTAELNEWISQARSVLNEFLESPAGQEQGRIAVDRGLSPTGVNAALDELIRSRRVVREMQGGDPALGRWLLSTAALASLERLPTLRVIPETKRLICKDYQFYATASASMDAVFAPARREFWEMAALARLERFIAGTQLHWQVSGIPRSWLAKMQARDALRLLRTAVRAGGFAPYFEAHIPSRGTPFLIQKEFERYYARMAQSMDLQPEILGVIGSSWLHAEETMAITPQLQWMNKLFLDHGGVLVHMQPAPLDSGFLLGSSKRRSLHESGAYHPRVALFVWPRKAFLKWSKDQLSPPS